MEGVFRVPRKVAAMASNPLAICMADRSPGGLPNRSVFSLAHRSRFRTMISFPLGSTRRQILASWLVSNRPAIGDAFAAAVPSCRLAVCPSARLRALASFAQLFDTPSCIMPFHAAEHPLEHVTVLSLSGAGNRVRQIGHTFQFRPAYFGAQVGQNCGVGLPSVLMANVSPHPGQIACPRPGRRGIQPQDDFRPLVKLANAAMATLPQSHLHSHATLQGCTLERQRIGRTATSLPNR